MIDAHTHLADDKHFSRIDEYMAEWARRGVHKFVQAGVDPTDWDRQLELATRFPGRIFTCFGVHPYFAAEQDLETSLAAIEQLKTLLGRFSENADLGPVALGETGLDFRSRYAPTPEVRHKQAQVFELQISLAKKTNLPLVLHIVRAHPEAQHILKKHLPLRGMVHAFNSSSKVAQEYLNLGLTLSVGPALLNAQNSALVEAVKVIPEDRLVFESDSPEAPPPSIFDVARMVADLRGQSLERTLKLHYENLIALYPRLNDESKS